MGVSETGAFFRSGLLSTAYRCYKYCALTDNSFGLRFVMMTSRYKGIAAIFTVCSTLIACSSTEEETYVEQKVEVLYNTAVSSLEAGDYGYAAKQFDEVER